MARVSKMAPKTKIGWYLKEQRKLEQITQKSMAEKLEIDSKTYNGYEVGGRRLSKKALYKIADYFEVEYKFLEGLNPEREEDKINKKTGVGAEFRPSIVVEKTGTVTSPIEMQDPEIKKINAPQPGTLDKRRIKNKDLPSQYFQLASVSQVIDQLKLTVNNWSLAEKSFSSLDNNSLSSILCIKEYQSVFVFEPHFLKLYYIKDISFITKVVLEYLGEPFLNIPSVESANTGSVIAGYYCWINNSFSNQEKLNLLIRYRPETLLTLLQEDSLTQIFINNQKTT